MLALLLGLSLFSVSKNNMWSHYGFICRCFCPSVNTICGCIIVGFILCHQSVSTICGRIMVGFAIVVVRQ